MPGQNINQPIIDNDNYYNQFEEYKNMTDEIFKKEQLFFEKILKSGLPIERIVLIMDNCYNQQIIEEEFDNLIQLLKNKPTISELMIQLLKMSSPIKTNGRYQLLYELANKLLSTSKST